MDREGVSQSALKDADDYAKVKPVRRKTARQSIASRDLRAQEMWEKGYGVKQIAAKLGIHLNSLGSYFGRIDPTPQPLGCPPFAGRAGESAEARAFRRFPINSHKPRTT